MNTNWFLSIILCFILVLVLFLLAIVFFWFIWKRILRKRKDSSGPLICAFFHPYCNAGGGGERVLWCALNAMKKRFAHMNVKYIIFTGDVDVAPDQIVLAVQKRFNIEVDVSNVEFIYLYRRYLIEAVQYPYFTLLGQSIGSIVLALEAMGKCIPDIFIDTMGFSFSLPVFKYVACARTAAYIHYPTISVDMLDKVQNRHVDYNNRSFIVRSKMATYIKLVYYQIFASFYALAGRCADVCMVNSSWTENHIQSLWYGRNKGSIVQKVYPPCNVNQFQSLQHHNPSDGLIRIISLGQFRPEKDHALQLRILYELRDILDEETWNKVRLVLIGGVRNDEDDSRVKDLKDLSHHLAVNSNVDFQLNISFDRLKHQMSHSLIGLHTMWNEHFGIAVVEMLAAGLITVAHQSGGPLNDIIEVEEHCRNGFLAVEAKCYASTIAHIISLSDEERDCIRLRGRSSTDRFNDIQFETSWLRSITPIVY